MGDEAREAGHAAAQHRVAARKIRAAQFGRVLAAQPVMQSERDGDDADDEPDRGRVQVAEQRGADGYAEQRSRNQYLEFGPDPAAVEPADRKQVHDTEDRQHDGSGLDRGDHQRHQRHGHDTEAAAEAAFGDAEENDCRNRDDVKPGIGNQGALPHGNS